MICWTSEIRVPGSEPDPALFQVDSLALGEGEADEGIAVMAVVTSIGDGTGTQDMELEVNGAFRAPRL